MFIWAVLLIMILAAAIVIAAVLLPRMYLKTRYTMTKSGDRGIKKIEEINGTSIVFEPLLKWRKYIKQYVLAERSGKKQLTCKIDPEISYLSYDIVLFNSCDEVFNVLTVKEKIEKEGYTKIVDLPAETSYVAISVNEVDAMDFSAPITGKVKAGNVAKFLLLVSLCILLEAICVKVCCANIFGGIFRESIVLNGWSMLVTLAIVGGLIFVNFIAALIAILVRGSKKHGWNK